MHPRRLFALCGLLLLALCPGSVRGEEKPGPASTPKNRPELVVQLGHPAAVHAAAFSPDGKFVLTSGADGTATSNLRALLRSIAVANDFRCEQTQKPRLNSGRVNQA